MLQSFLFVKKSNYFTLPPCYISISLKQTYKLLTTGSLLQHATSYFYPTPCPGYLWGPPSTVWCIRWSSENETWNSRPSTAAIRNRGAYVVIKGMTVRYMHNFILLHPLHRQLTEEQSSPARSCVLTAYHTMSNIKHNVGGSSNIIQVDI